MGSTNCRACGAPINFIKTKKGTSMPVDAEGKWVATDPEGIPYVLADGSVVMAKAFEGAMTPEDAKQAGYQMGYTSHFATCPNADKFRKPRKSTRKKG